MAEAEEELDEFETEACLAGEDRARARGQLEVHVDALLSAAMAVEDVMAQLGADSGELAALVERMEAATRAVLAAPGDGEGSPLGSPSSVGGGRRTSEERATARETARQTRLSRWNALRSDVGAGSFKGRLAAGGDDDGGSGGGRSGGGALNSWSRRTAKVADIVDVATGKVTATAEQLDELLSTRTVKAARPPMSDAVSFAWCSARSMVATQSASVSAGAMLRCTLAH